MKRGNKIYLEELPDEKELKRIEPTLRRNAEIVNEVLVGDGGMPLGEIRVFARGMTDSEKREFLRWSPEGRSFFVAGWEEVSDSVTPS